MLPAAEGPGGGSFPAAEGQVVGRLTLATTLIICILLRHFSWFSSPGADLYFGIPHGDQFPIVPANIHRVLFSLRNGWMVYTPLVIPAISGFYLLAEKNRAVYYAAFLIILVSLVFAGSIPRWWYNDSFGYPNLVEVYAVLSIPLGYVVQWIWQRRRITRIFLVTAAGLLVLLNLFQTWQFGRSIIVPEKMTGKYYLAAFGRTSALPSNTGLTGSPGPALNDTIPGNMPVTCTKVNSFDFEQAGNDWDAHRSGRYAHSGRFSLRMSPEFSFSPGMIVPVRQLTSTDSSWIRATAHFFYTCKPAENILFLVITCLHDGVPYKYRAARMMDERFRPWCWNTVTMSYLLPLPAYPDDAVNVYFWNFGQNECYIDDFRIDLCKPVRP